MSTIIEPEMKELLKLLFPDLHINTDCSEPSSPRQQHDWDNVDFLMDTHVVGDTNALQQALMMANLFRRASMPIMPSHSSVAAPQVPLIASGPPPQSVPQQHQQNNATTAFSPLSDASCAVPPTTATIAEQTSVGSGDMLPWSQPAPAPLATLPAITEAADCQATPLTFINATPTLSSGASKAPAAKTMPKKLRTAKGVKKNGGASATSTDNAESSDSSQTSAAITYMCKICDKTFTRPSSLATHMYTHTGEKPHECMYPGCGKSFSVRSNLRRHMRIHEEGYQSARDRRKAKAAQRLQLHPYAMFPFAPPTHNFPMLANQAHRVEFSVPFPQTPQSQPAIAFHQPLLPSSSDMLVLGQYPPLDMGMPALPAPAMSGQSSLRSSPTDPLPQPIASADLVGLGLQNNTQMLATPPGLQADGTYPNGVHVRRYSTPVVSRSGLASQQVVYGNELLLMPAASGVLPSGQVCGVPPSGELVGSMPSAAMTQMTHDISFTPASTGMNSPASCLGIPTIGIANVPVGGDCELGQQLMQQQPPTIVYPYSGPLFS